MGGGGAGGKRIVGRKMVRDRWWVVGGEQWMMDASPELSPNRAKQVEREHVEELEIV